jgi:uncharacterized protein
VLFRSNAEFGRILGEVMKRPYWLPAPAFALRLLLGEMSSLVLEGQFMVPQGLLDAGYKFQYKDARSALCDLLKG